MGVGAEAVEMCVHILCPTRASPIFFSLPHILSKHVGCYSVIAMSSILLFIEAIKVHSTLQTTEHRH